jgi:hypothetical protein
MDAPVDPNTAILPIEAKYFEAIRAKRLALAERRATR